MKLFGYANFFMFFFDWIVFYPLRGVGSTALKRLEAEIRSELLAISGKATRAEKCTQKTVAAGLDGSLKL